MHDLGPWSGSPESPTPKDPRSNHFAAGKIKPKKKKKAISIITNCKALDTRAWEQHTGQQSRARYCNKQGINRQPSSAAHSPDISALSSDRIYHRMQSKTIHW